MPELREEPSWKQAKTQPDLTLVCAACNRKIIILVPATANTSEDQNMGQPAVGPEGQGENYIISNHRFAVYCFAYLQVSCSVDLLSTG